MELKLADLKQTIDLIFNHIANDLNITTVQVEKSHDFYWEIPLDKLSCEHKSKPELDIGRLSDDWNFLKKILDDDNDQAVSLMLIHVAPLLRYIGTKIGQ